MKRVLMAVVLVASCCGFARADDAAKHAKAEKLISVMHMDTMLDQMRGTVRSQMAEMVKSVPGADDFNAKQKAILNEFMDKATDLAMSQLTVEKLRSFSIDVYMKAFSEDELDAMYAFYSSPTGQKVVMKMPEVMQSTMSLVQQTMMDMMPKMQELGTEYVKRIMDAGAAADGAPTAAPVH